MKSQRREAGDDVRIAGTAATGFFALYLATLCPTVYLGDVGEICAAIAGGGTFHPPGYPLFSLLGRLAVLLPFGEVAFRIGILVALAGAGAVGVFFLTARAVGASRLPAFLAAGAFGAGYTFWSQCVRVEVYSLHLLLALTALWAALRFRATGNSRWLYAAALAFSLGLAHHLTIVLLAPALAVLCFAPWRACARPGRVLVTLLPLFLVGPSLYGLLWFWAAGKPLLASGDPSTPQLLWYHASARLFQGMFLRLPDSNHWREWAGTAGYLLSDNLPFGLFVPAGLGLVLLGRRNRTVGAALTTLLACVSVYNLCYRITDIAPYFLIVWAVLALGLAVTLTWAQDRLPRLHEPRPALSFGLALLVLVPIARNWSACDLSDATWLRDFARDKLESAAAGAVLITQDDPDSFPIWYVRDVLGVRRDVLPLDRLKMKEALQFYERDPSQWYLKRLQREGIPVALGVPEDPLVRRRLTWDGLLLELLEGPLRGRPVYSTFLRTQGRQQPPFVRWALQQRRPVPVGLLVRLDPPGQTLDVAALIRDNERCWERIKLPEAAVTRAHHEVDPDYVVRHYNSMFLSLGDLYEKTGHQDRARRVYELHSGWAPTPDVAAAGRVALRRLDLTLAQRTTRAKSP